MNIWGKSGLALVLTVGWLGLFQPAAAQAATVHMFVREDCAHCRDAKDFLAGLDQVEAKYYDLAEEENGRLFEQVTDKYEIQKATPITLINGMLLVGFDAPETTGKRWQELLNKEEREVSFADIVDGGAEVEGGDS